MSPAVRLGAAGAALVAMLAGPLAGRPAGARTLRIDAARSQLVVRTFRDGVAARLAHDHVVRATEISGVAEYDPAHPDETSLVVEAATASLRVDDPALRRQFELPGDPSESDRAEIEKAMRASGQLDVARFPSIRFASSRITRQADGRYRVTGVLTIHGVAREVRFAADVTPEDGGLRGRASLTLRQSSFGLAPYRALLGAIRNKDEIVLHVDLIAVP